MADRVDRRKFLGISAKAAGLSILAPEILLAALTSSSDRPESLIEEASQADYSKAFDQLFETATNQKDVKLATRLGGPENGLILIRFGETVTSGLLVLEKGYRPTGLLGYYEKDDTAKSIDLTSPGSEKEHGARLLVATWKGQAPLRFLPPEKYTNADEGVVEPHKLTSKELGPFLAKVITSFNSNRLPPLDQ